MLKYAKHYSEVESGIRALLRAEKEVFTVEETMEVEEFIDVREYGLALETFAAILLERAESLDLHRVREIERLAGTMGLTGERAINDIVDACNRQKYKIAM